MIEILDPRGRHLPATGTHGKTTTTRRKYDRYKHDKNVGVSLNEKNKCENQPRFVCLSSFQINSVTFSIIAHTHEHTHTRTTSQVNNLLGSPLISASKVYPAGKVAGAVTCTIIGKSGRTKVAVFGFLVAMVQFVSFFLYIIFQSLGVCVYMIRCRHP